MLETLTQGFRNARDRFRGVAELSDSNISDALSDVRSSLLEADVDLGIVREFLAKVQERVRGEVVRLEAGKKSGQKLRVSAGDHFTKACYDELVALMGSGEPLEPVRDRTRAIMLLGLQGTGKTSTAAKLAKYLKSKGDRPLLVAADVRRPAAREQLRVLGEAIGVPVFSRDGDDAPAICAEALAFARAEKRGSVILDTAGRLQIDDELMHELEEIQARTKPEHVTLICDAMMGREAVNVARGFASRIPIDGLILTKLDGDSRGGAALAIRAATGVPVRFVTMGEATDRLEAFRPEGLAQRMLGMGDVVGLMNDFEAVVDVEEAEKDAERMLRGKFSFDDFLTQLRTIQKMGSLTDLLAKIPGVSDMMPEGVKVDPQELRRIEAMITSMTPAERRQPETITPSRQNRIARGSGTKVTDVAGLLQRFKAMREMMASLGGAGGLLGKIPGVGRMFGKGGGPPEGFDPAALAGMGGIAPNRRAARAQKALAKREQRKAQKKHKRRGKRH
ncbi:MAG TPA: signal recognition particle receptor subunit alpha [Myxococcota bacterium]|nr:signal recognition particle receptor subunit alpha [Myxococcota bacterium]